MEFTYNGLVRQGFGFANPNHAAAFLCALLPLVWSRYEPAKTRSCRFAILTVSALLACLLALTYSRTGLLVLVGEALLFTLLTRGRGWKAPLVTLAASAAAWILAEGSGRLTVDAAASNRVLIWNAGLELLRANFFSGTGGGVCGLLASVFLLPEGVVCRTLVNSHLTLAVEYGAGIGLLWSGWIVYALLVGKRFPALRTAFAGLAVSAFCASVFDWGLLFDFTDMGGAGIVNFGLSWLLFLFFLAAGAVLCFGQPDLRRGLAAVVIGAGLLGSVYLMVPCTGPVVRNGQVIKAGPNPQHVFYDETFSLKEIKFRLKDADGYYLPLRPTYDIPPEIRSGIRRAVFFGHAAELADALPGVEKQFIRPPVGRGTRSDGVD